ncbi:MAG: energy-coupling factor transporter transmembrane protein EcfT, partial [Firmicutes bacterium]|nr:energy-coupling factor transporter transmembrane protein EcfT [Bacillota bacterium]
DFETGSLLKRAKNLIPIMVPLFISSFRIAQDLAMAMEARCYRGGEGRTRMNAMKMTRLDTAAFIAQVVFAALIIILGH